MPSAYFFENAALQLVHQQGKYDWLPPERKPSRLRPLLLAARSFHWATAVVQPNQALRTYSNGAIVAFTQQLCLVLIGGIRFSLDRFASVRPIVIGLASSQSSTAPANSQSSRPPAVSAPSTRPPCVLQLFGQLGIRKGDATPTSTTRWSEPKSWRSGSSTACPCTKTIPDDPRPTAFVL